MLLLEVKPARKTNFGYNFTASDIKYFLFTYPALFSIQEHFWGGLWACKMKHKTLKSYSCVFLRRPVALLLWERLRWRRRKKTGGNKIKIKPFLVAANIVASRLPERWPTGTPTVRANWLSKEFCSLRLYCSVEDKKGIDIWRTTLTCQWWMK